MRTVLRCALLALVGAPALGQGQLGPEDPFPFSHEPPAFVILAAREIFEGPTVPHVPYSARTETQIVRPLVDGNRIVQRTSGFVARDGAGRLRREQSIAAIGRLFGGSDAPTIVILNDTVAGVAYFLDERSKTAHKRSSGDRSGPRLPSLDFERMLAPGSADLVKEESLGTKTDEGLRLEGTRRTATIPPGAVGNEKAIVTVLDRWYSPELQVVVSTIQQDPRIGEIHYRLTGISTSEPDPALFVVPAGYKVVVGGARPGGGPDRDATRRPPPRE